MKNLCSKQRNPFIINEHLPFQMGGVGISPHTQRLDAIACALGWPTRKIQLFNYHNSIRFYREWQAPSLKDVVIMR